MLMMKFFFKKASKWILFYVIHTLLPFLLPITLAIQERPLRGQIFSRQNRFQFFHHHFSKKLRQISKKPKRSCIVWCSCEFISKHEIFLSMKKTVKKTLPGFFFDYWIFSMCNEKCIKKDTKLPTLNCGVISVRFFSLHQCLAKFYFFFFTSLSI